MFIKNCGEFDAWNNKKKKKFEIPFFENINFRIRAFGVRSFDIIFHRCFSE